MSWQCLSQWTGTGVHDEAGLVDGRPRPRSWLSDIRSSVSLPRALDSVPPRPHPRAGRSRAAEMRTLPVPRPRRREDSGQTWFGRRRRRGGLSPGLWSLRWELGWREGASPLQMTGHEVRTVSLTGLPERAGVPHRRPDHLVADTDAVDDVPLRGDRHAGLCGSRKQCPRPPDPAPSGSRRVTSRTETFLGEL